MKSMKKLPKKYQEAKNKFRTLSDKELAILRHQFAGAIPGLTAKIFSQLDDNGEAEYDLDVLVQLECQRRGLIPTNFAHWIDARGNRTNPKNGVIHPDEGHYDDEILDEE